MAQVIHQLTVRTSTGKTLTGGAAWAALDTRIKKGRRPRKDKGR